MDPTEDAELRPAAARSTLDAEVGGRGRAGLRRGADDAAPGNAPPDEASLRQEGVTFEVHWTDVASTHLLGLDRNKRLDGRRDLQELLVERALRR